MRGRVGTLFGTGGPFYVIYLRLRDLDKSAFRATFATNFLIDGGIRLIAYTVMGLYGQTTLFAVALALPVAVVALLAGGRIHTGLSQPTFMRLISGETPTAEPADDDAGPPPVGAQPPSFLRVSASCCLMVAGTREPNVP
jgi:hypothetical protein